MKKYPAHRKEGEKIPKGLEMYFNPEIAELFSEREQNERNFRVSEIINRLIMFEITGLKDPIYAAELGGGAHPDRYHKFFKRLLEKPQGSIDWVDISPHMLNLAKRYISNKKYENRKKVINFIQREIVDYLKNLSDGKLDLAIAKYTFDHIKDVEEFFNLLSRKLKPSGRFVATISAMDPRIESIHPNARFLYNGKEFPENETRTLKDGDTFTIKFFKETGNPSAGYLEGAETVKYYHSPEKLRSLAQKYGFEIFLGEWKDWLPKEKQDGEKIDQNVLVLKKGNFSNI